MHTDGSWAGLGNKWQEGAPEWSRTEKAQGFGAPQSLGGGRRQGGGGHDLDSAAASD